MAQATEYIFLTNVPNDGLLQVYAEQLKEAGIPIRTQSYTADAFSSLGGAGMLGSKLFVPEDKRDEATQILGLSEHTNTDTGEVQTPEASEGGGVFHAIATLFVALGLLILLLFSL